MSDEDKETGPCFEPYRLLSDLDIERLQPSPWLVAGIIPQGAVAVLYGDPGIGKSFLALDWAMCIALGAPWQGRDVKQGSVLYIIFEGCAGFSSRVHAWKKANQISESIPIFFLVEPITLLNSQHYRRLIATLETLPTPPRLIVIDTLARALVGADENSAKEVGNFIFVIDLIRKITGATILLVHHTGKNANAGERGSTALRGAADTMVSLNPSNAGGLSLECEKQKDAEQFEPISLAISNIDLGENQSSCVLIANDRCFIERPMGENDKKALQVLHEVGPEGATSTEWLKASKLPESTFHRVRRNLEMRALVGAPVARAKGGKYTLTEEGRNAVTAT